MKVKELKEIIEDLENNNYNLEEIDVVVPTMKLGCVGAVPSTSIQRALKGFDWDSNKLLLYPETILREIELDEIKYLREKYEELGGKVYEINNNLKRENKELRDKINKLEQQ